MNLPKVIKIFDFLDVLVSIYLEHKYLVITVVLYRTKGKITKYVVKIERSNTH